MTTAPTLPPASASASARRAPARILAAYLATGLLFMLIPGTFMGVLNLLQVSARGSVSLVPAAWLQAHGHAQVFGWVGTFILGIGFYSIPALRTGGTSALAAAWSAWAMWTSGVAMRWATLVYGGPWRVLLPASALLELAAFLTFMTRVASHRPAPTPDSERATAPARWRLDPWVTVVMAGSVGLLVTLVANVGLCVWLAWGGVSAELPHAVDQRVLVLVAWGFLAPFVWGFSLRWLPGLLRLSPARTRLVPFALVVNVAGVVLALFGLVGTSTGFFVVSATLMTLAVRPFSARATGTVSVFVRLAYVWLIAAALLGVAAARFDLSGGIWGASRHAFTVGFVAAMVFAIGQRMLPGFMGRVLWSAPLMLVTLTLLSAGCLLRVSSEILAYQGYAAWAWHVLPVSALIEMAAVTGFAANLGVTLLSDRRQSSPAVAAIQAAR